MVETKAKPKTAPAQDGKESFRKAAQSRVVRATKLIRSLGEMHKSRVYDYTPEQVTEITKFLTAEVDSARQQMQLKFTQKKAEPEVKFSL